MLSQTRNLETAQDNLIAAQTTYAVDRASLSQLVADTLQKYGISITDAATGNVTQEPNVPGLEAPQPEAKPEPLHPNQGQNGNDTVTPAPATQSPQGIVSFRVVEKIKRPDRNDLAFIFSRAIAQ